MINSAGSERYAKVIAVSRRVRWELDRDVFRGRTLDFSQTFLPSSLSLVNELAFLSPADKRLFSQVQGRTYAYIFGLVERFIVAKVLDLGRGHAMGDQVALEALVRMADEEVKHQELFRRLEAMIAAGMPAGYEMTADPDAVAKAVLGASDWAVLALTLDIELFTMAHYRASIEPDANMSALWKDVFLFHWKEESQHAMLDELELARVHASLDEAQIDAAVTELIRLVGAVDGILQAQAAADARYFIDNAAAAFSETQRELIHATVLKAYRWQYVISGVMEPRLRKVLFSLVNDAQAERINRALAPLTYAVPKQPEVSIPMAA